MRWVNCCFALVPRTSLMRFLPSTITTNAMNKLAECNYVRNVLCFEYWQFLNMVNVISQCLGNLFIRQVGFFCVTVVYPLNIFWNKTRKCWVTLVLCPVQWSHNKESNFHPSTSTSVEFLLSLGIFYHWSKTIVTWSRKHSSFTN